VSEEPTWNGPIIGPEIAWTTAVELPALLLLFWLMRRMSAVAHDDTLCGSAAHRKRGGIPVLRPSLRLRAGLGILLIAASAGWLLSGREEEADAGPLPLNLKRN